MASPHFRQVDTPLIILYTPIDEKSTRSEGKAKVSWCDVTCFLFLLCLLPTRRWEEIYGAKAKHAAKSQKAKKGWAIVLKEKSAVGESTCAVKRGKDANTLILKPESKGVKEAIDKSLHPSWQASKRRKELVSSFMGQRTVFSDSDWFYYSVDHLPVNHLDLRPFHNRTRKKRGR